MSSFAIYLWFQRKYANIINITLVSRLAKCKIFYTEQKLKTNSVTLVVKISPKFPWKSPWQAFKIKSFLCSHLRPLNCGNRAVLGKDCPGPKRLHRAIVHKMAPLVPQFQLVHKLRIYQKTTELRPIETPRCREAGGCDGAGTWDSVRRGKEQPGGMPGMFSRWQIPISSKQRLQRRPQICCSHFYHFIVFTHFFNPNLPSFIKLYPKNLTSTNKRQKLCSWSPFNGHDANCKCVIWSGIDSNTLQ